MSREIKFRLWHREKKYWLESLFVYVDASWSSTRYTGLHDKNGKEIYEADILKFRLNTKYGLIEKIGIVRCESLASGCTVNFVPHEADSLPLGLDIINPVIIGNEFENPELLQEGK